MAEAQAVEQKAEASGGGRSWLPLLLVGLLCLGAGAGGGWFLFGRGAPAEAAAEASEHGEAGAEAEAGEGAEGHAEAGAKLQERMLSLEPFVVNVSGEGYPRYLKLKVELETEGPGGRQELEAQLAQVRDAIILLLSSKRLADIEDFEGKALLKDDLRERVNALLESGEVKSVLFTEFVVQ